MNTKHLKITTAILPRIPLLLLYTVFFFVQLFYNFGDAHQKDDVTPVSFYQNQAKQQQESLKKTGPEKHKHTKIRLNKRFQPETLFLDNANFVSIAIVADYATATNTSCYFGKIIPNAFLQTHLMRGPPVVA